MATVSLSPTPISLSAMSTRRLPLSSNPNVANSPLRGALAAHGSKRIRSYAELQREEAYGQPPPAKRQMVEHGVQRSLRSPQKMTRLVPQRQSQSTRASTTDRSAQSTSLKLSEKEIDNVRQWQAQTRSRFPKMVFYFESLPDEQRVKLTKQFTHLGAREEKFFSINITHVVTTRSIPSEKAVHDASESNVDAPASHEQPKTIDPSLLNRTTEILASAPPVKRKLLFETTASRRPPVQIHEDTTRRPKTRNADVLVRAREMGKKIWSLDKLQKILDMVLEPDPYKSALLGQGLRSAALKESSAARAAEPSNLLQLLQNERVHGPSDRDPTVTTKELNYFKGPYLYVYDIEEKQKPIMVREYAKVADKQNGDWPQFRVAAQGRCPFIGDVDPAEKARGVAAAKERVSKAAVEAKAPLLKPPQIPPPKPVTGKRSLAEMDDAHNRGAAPASRRPSSFDITKISNPPTVDFRAGNAFTSRARTGRFFAGEPVASGVQPSHITSAIRSQMISSTTGALGAKAGTSKEIHGLQRKVLQKNNAPAVAQEASSRRFGEMSHDSNTFIRSASLVGTSNRKLDMIDEDDAVSRKAKLRRAESASASTQAKQHKRDPKPGYCENCQDKFDDFENHIASRKHRKFAENDDNWAELDFLLLQLKRPPRYRLDDDDDENHW